MKALIALASLLAAACAGQPIDPSSEASAKQAPNDGWTKDFPEDPHDLQTTGRNTYFILEPGYTLEYVGDERETLVIRVLEETVEVGGIQARVVEEHELRGTEVIEISRNYFVISSKTNNVYYLGEDVDMYKHGQVSGHAGAWRHGSAGAHFGLLMPASPRLGQRYYQELAPGEALDRSEVVGVSEKVTIPAGAFERCLKVEETTPLEPGEKEYKFYAPDVGLIRDADMRLVRYGKR